MDTLELTIDHPLRSFRLSVAATLGRETLALCRDALAEGAKNALPVGIACALVGVIIGTLTLTGQLDVPSNESCEVTLSAPAKVFVQIRGYATNSTFDLVGRRN